MNHLEKNEDLSKLIKVIAKSQEEFTSKALLILSLGVKNIYSKEEAAAFLNLDPDYMYQLKFANKIKAYKKKGQKKIYFKKEDLENYLLSENDVNNSFEEFENKITNKWKK